MVQKKKKKKKKNKHYICVDLRFNRYYFARRKGITIARKMYMRFVLHLPCLHLRGLSVI